MKKILLVCLLALTSISYSQTPTEKSTYAFKIQSITNESDAKYALELLRNIFDVLPVFNEANQVFTVVSTTPMTEELLVQKLSAQSYVLSSYSKVVMVSTTNMEE